MVGCTVQERMWKIGQDIGDKEGRLDVCVAAAGILKVIPTSECTAVSQKEVHIPHVEVL